MAKIHKYDMSRRLDDGKWEVVGKGYQDSQTGRITVWVEPAKMAKIIKGQKEGVPFILFDKDPAPIAEPVKATAPSPCLAPGSQRTKSFEPKPSVPPPIVAKPSDSWPPDFDDDIHF